MRMERIIRIKKKLYILFIANVKKKKLVIIYYIQRAVI